MAQAGGPKVRAFAKDAVILRKGEPSDGVFYYLQKGSAVVEVDGRIVGEIRAGEFFGELAAILNEPRTADVVALTPCEVLEFRGLDNETFYRWLRANPKVLRRMIETFARRIRDLNVRHTEEMAKVRQDAARVRSGVQGTIAAMERIAETFQSRAMAEVLEHLKATTGVANGDPSRTDRTFFRVSAKAFAD